MQPVTILRPRVLCTGRGVFIDGVLGEYLAEVGFDVSYALNAAMLTDAINRERYQLVLLDFDLPGGGALELVTMVYADTDALVFGLLDADTPPDDYLQALENGADDLLVKPISARELALRARNATRRMRLLRRSSRAASRRIRAAGLVLDEKLREVSNGSTTVRLTPAERSVLSRLMSADGELVEREQLLAGLSHDAGVENPNTLDTVIYRLRRKLKAFSPEQQLILTVPGAGFRLQSRPWHTL